MAKLQNEDFKTSAEIVSAGGTASQLLNDSKIYVTGNGINDTLSNAIVNGQIGGGGGSKNYLTVYTAGTSGGVANPGNGDFERNSTTGWSLAHTTLSSKFPTSVAAAGTPFSSTQGGTAASGNLSLTVSSSTPLQKKYMGVLASSAASVAGDLLISDAFYIDPEDQAKVLQFSFAYKVASGATNMDFSGTSSNTYAVYIYDVTGAAWIQPAGVYNLVQTSGVGICTGTFQTTASGTRYQIALVNITASAGAFTMNVDDFAVGPQTVSMGPAMKDPTSFTMSVTTTGGSGPTYGTVQKNVASWRQIGDVMEVTWTYRQTSAGTAGTAGAYLLNMPSGFSIDTSKVSTYSVAPTTSGTTYGATQVGTGWIANTSTGNAIAANGVGVFVYDSTRLAVNHYATVAGASYPWSTTMTLNFSSADLAVTVTFRVPIVGWSSNTAQSSSADTKVISSRRACTSTATTVQNTDTLIVWDTAIFDTAGGWTSSSVYTATVTGFYRVSAKVLPVNTQAGINASIKLYKNGVNTYELAYGTNANAGQPVPSLNGSTIIQLNAGDTLSFYWWYTADANARALSGSAAQNWVAIDRISGPAIVQATDTIAASYWASANFASSTTIPINFDSKEFDYTNSVTTSATAWKFTAPVSGLYSIKGYLNATVGGSTLTLYKNGSAYKSLGYLNSGGASVPTPSSAIRLNAGDYIDFRAVTSGTIQGGTLATAGTSYISIIKIGN